jgi:hypothetical protein
MLLLLHGQRAALYCEVVPEYFRYDAECPNFDAFLSEIPYSGSISCTFSPANELSETT